MRKVYFLVEAEIDGPLTNEDIAEGLTGISNAAFGVQIVACQELKDPSIKMTEGRTTISGVIDNQ